MAVEAEIDWLDAAFTHLELLQDNTKLTHANIAQAYNQRVARLNATGCKLDFLTKEQITETLDTPTSQSLEGYFTQASESLTFDEIILYLETLVD